MGGLPLSGDEKLSPERWNKEPVMQRLKGRAFKVRNRFKKALRWEKARKCTNANAAGAQ